MFVLSVISIKSKSVQNDYEWDMVIEESICVSADVQQASLLPFEAVRCSEQPAGVYESGSTQRLTSFRLRSEPQGRLPGPVPPVGYTHVLKHNEWGGEIDNLIHLK